MLTWLFGSSLPVRIIYTVLFFFLAAVTAYSPGRMQKLLGRIMGPVLIGLILLLAAGTLLQPANTGAVQQVYSSAPFVTGFFEGYQTLDLLAAFNLGAAFTLQIKSLGIKNEKTEHNVRVLAVLTAGVLLCTVYTTLAVLGMKQSAIMEGMKNGAQVLSALANVGFGQTGRVIIGLIFLIACFNVCSSILSTAAQYYHSQWKWMPYKTIVTVFAVLGAVTACLGLDVIVSYTAPILSFLCPVALIFMIAGGIHYRKEQKKKRALLESGALAPADSIQ
jgi:LIVCS family branched-chain amino acid:cation transporter